MTVTAALATTESLDSAAFLVADANTAALAATESRDSAVFFTYGTLPKLIGLAATEAQDVASFIAEPLPALPPRSFLPPNATPFELASEAAGSTRFGALQPTAIFDAMDPAAIPSSLLPWLAWGLKLEIWDPDWSDEFKRWAIANSIKWHYQKGTLAGIEAYLNLVGTQLVAAVTPPARTYLCPALTAAQRAAYLTNFPQLRVYPYVAGAMEKGAFCGAASDGLPKCFLNNVFPHDMQTPERYTRTAEIVTPSGVVTNLPLVTISEGGIAVSAYAYDQISLPVGPTNRFFLGGGFLGECLGTPLQATEVVYIPVTTDFVFATPRVTDQTVTPGFGLMDIEPTDIAQVHQRQPFQSFLGHIYMSAAPPATTRLVSGGDFSDDFSDDFSNDPITILTDTHPAGAFTTPSVAWQYMYQLWYLFDPAYQPQTRNAYTFLDWTRLGIPPYTAELQVNIQGQAKKWETWGFVSGCLRSPMQTAEQIYDTLEAVRLSMSGRDTILINTTTVRPIQPSDALAVGSATVGQWTPAAP